MKYRINYSEQRNAFRAQIFHYSGAEKVWQTVGFFTSKADAEGAVADTMKGLSADIPKRLQKYVEVAK